MIDCISIFSFKSFPRKDISLGKLTVLTGLNNSGKSTALQALRMCFASATNGSPYIDGLGAYHELRSQFSEINSPITLAAMRESKDLVRLEINAKGHNIKKFKGLPFFEYISADRYGPRVSLPLMDDDVSHLSVGSFGQYSAHFAQIFENTIVNPTLRYPDSASNTLRHQLVKWVGEISPGVKLDFDVATRYDSSSLAVDGNRSTNSGYGISYTLPIILALLSLTGSVGIDKSNEKTAPWFKHIGKFGAVLAIENPEAHLHPRGQTNMGKLIALAAAAGLQIIVETHSDHLLDGIRLVVKNSNEAINGENVKIKFFSKSEINGTEIEEIVLRDDGKLDHWPTGFFDQFSINLRSLSVKNG